MLAEDEAKLCIQATPQAVWAPRGHTPQVRIDPRKDTTSFFGTLNLQTGGVTTTQADTLNAETTIAHLEAVLTAYPDRPILLLWDRAPWHTAAKVQQFLQQQWRIEVIWFPVGAPDLNPQEHVWKAVRRTVHHNHAHPDLVSLAAAFRHELETRRFPSSFVVKYGGTLVCPFLEGFLYRYSNTNFAGYLWHQNPLCLEDAMYFLEDYAKVHERKFIRQPHFPVDEAFVSEVEQKRNGQDKYWGVSYSKRYEILCRRLMEKDLYRATCLILATNEEPPKVTLPSEELSFRRFMAKLLGHAITFRYGWSGRHRTGVRLCSGYRWRGPGAGRDFRCCLVALFHRNEAGKHFTITIR
ncbi:IS630 family transposase [Candidatus Gracilibacteria bacterium]|nr:IS630 family transposase [Candidatus Gracilibacteria bacterium]